MRLFKSLSQFGLVNNTKVEKTLLAFFVGHVLSIIYVFVSCDIFHPKLRDVGHLISCVLILINFKIVRFEP